MRSRSLIVVLLLAVLAVGLVAATDLRELIGRPWPGFGVLPNGEVGPSFLTSRSLAGVRGVPRFQERILAVAGNPVEGRGALLRLLADVSPGAVVRYTVETPGGRQQERTLPAPPFTRQDATELYLPLFVGGTLGLLLGAVPVLARPELLSAWVFFLLNLGLTLNFGYLTLDWFAIHRFVPLGLLGGVLASAGITHLTLLLPEPVPLLTRWPRMLPALVYGASAVVWTAWGFALYRWPAALRVLDAAEVGLFAVAAAILAWNVGRCRNARDATTRRLARVLGTTVLASCAVGGLLLLATTFSGLDGRLPMAVHLMPLWILVPVVAWSMVAHNLFELDAVVRRGLTAALVTLGALALQGAVYLALRPFADGPMAWAVTATLAVIAVAGIAVVTGVPSNLEALVERTLFPRLAVARAVVHDAGRELVRLRDEGEIAGVLRQALQRSLTATRVHLLAAPADGPLVEIGAIASSPSLTVPRSDPLHEIAAGMHSVRLEASPGCDGAERSTPSRAAELGMRLAVPLPAAGDVRGALLLGPRADGRLYTRDDEVLAETLAAQAAVALEHARAWSQVQGLERRLQAENLYLREEIEERSAEGGELVGRSPALRALLGQIDRVAGSDAAVFVQGETGTGKELVVRMLHARSRRRDRVLVRIACAALPESLLESELFGHERGAFTGAVGAKPGRFEVADGGTLFLDDVDTLPPGVQAKLLRALQEGEIQRLGSNRVRTVDVRVVAATNRELLAEVRAGRFREDLYYRLHVVPLVLPPLRDRLEDIPLLVEHFIRQDGPRLNPAVRAVSAEMLAALARHSWPGNVRELRNVVQRALVLARDEVLRLAGPLEPARGGGEVGSEVDDVLGAGTLADQLRAFKVRLIQAALDRSRGNQRIAAELLGLHRQSLTRHIRDLGLHDAPRAERRDAKKTGLHT